MHPRFLRPREELVGEPKEAGMYIRLEFSGVERPAIAFCRLFNERWIAELVVE